MLTGERAFARESTIETLNAILKEDPPDPTTTRADLPAALDRIVRHCLEKNPAERFQSARDVIFALESLTGGVTSSAARAAVPVPARRIVTSERLAWALAAILGLGLLASWQFSRAAATDDRPPTFVAIGAPFHRFHLHAAPAISPDGSTLAFWAPDANGQVKLCVRNLHSPDARALPDTVITDSAEDGMQPSFSPDGRNLLVFLDRKLKRIAIDGGSPQTLADAPIARSASWGITDQIVYRPSVGGPMFVIPAAGGTPRPLTEASSPDDRPRAGPRHPSFLPDGKHFVFNNLEAIYAASIEGGPAREIVRVGSRAEYANGRLLYVKDGSLMAHPFDPVSLAVTGEPVRVAEKVGAGLTSSIDFAFSTASNGTLAYWEGRTTPLSELVWVDRSGRRVGTLGQPAHYFGMSVNGDLSRVAFEHLDLSVVARDVVTCSGRRARQRT
jgi:hypothetical protein